MRVRAIERGYDNICVREPGDIFDMPDHMFTEKRPVLDGGGIAIPGKFYSPNPWFEPVDDRGLPILGKFEKEAEQNALTRGTPEQKAAAQAVIESRAAQAKAADARAAAEKKRREAEAKAAELAG